MVDELRVLRLLRAATDDLAVLRREAAAEETRRTDPMWLSGIKYTFLTAIEACVDIAQHLCSSEGWGPPNDNGDAMTLLGRHGVLDAALARAMRQAVGFRKVLAHEYVAVDDQIVLARLADFQDLDRFARAIGRYLT